MSTAVMTGWEPWVASVGLALVTLVIKTMAEWKHEQQLKDAASLPPEQPTPRSAA